MLLAKVLRLSVGPSVLIKLTLYNRLGVNHFVCIPVNTATVQAAFQDLKGKIMELDNAADAKIDSSIFISEKKLHLTILVLKLYSNKSRDLAAKV